MTTPSGSARCACGHLQSQHIYHEGACRPGFVCPCEVFVPNVVVVSSTAQFVAPAEPAGVESHKDRTTKFFSPLGGECICAYCAKLPWHIPAEPAGERTPSDEVSAEDLFWSDAANILCRAFDDFDAAMEEFREWYKPSDWLHGYRGLGAFIGIRRKAELAKALAALPSAPRERKVTEEMVERGAKHIAHVESLNCRTLEDAAHHRTKWRRMLFESRAFLTAALSPSPDGVQK